MDQAWSVDVERGPLRAMPLHLPPLGEDEVAIRVDRVGLCHSDLHLLDGDWGRLKAPFIPGHEVVGRVVEVGAAVDPKRLGSRVGVGWLARTCGRCRECLRGWENLCREKVETCVGRPGGLATRLQVSSAFAFDVPEALPSDAAAPLLCAGATMYGALRGRGISAGDRVAIVGVGGLGHLGIALARALGAEVCAVSASPEKEALARSLGASSFVSPEGLFDSNNRGRFDLIVHTAPAAFDVTRALRSLAARGALVFAGAFGGAFTVKPGHLVSRQRSISGVEIAPPSWIRDLLVLAADHGIRPIVESVDIDGLDEAFSRLRINAVRLRAVVRIPQLASEES